MADYEEAFKQGLIEDVAASEDIARRQEASTGLKAPSDFAPRRLRIKGQAVGEAELDKFNIQLKTALDDLVYESGLVDEQEQSKFRSSLTKKMNQIKLAMLKAAGQSDIMAKRRGLDEKGRQQTNTALTQTAGILAQMGISGLGKTPKKTDFVETPDFAPTPTPQRSPRGPLTGGDYF